MFALVVHEDERPPWRKAFAIRDCTIGAAPDNALVLDARKRIASYHARIVTKDGKYILVDLKSGSGTWLNDRRIAAPVIVKESDRVVVGDIRLEIVTLAYEELAGARFRPRDATEAKLVDAIAHGDEASREVYADWLEGHGDHARAELLRIQRGLDGIADDARLAAGAARMRQLVAAIDLPWRARLSKLPIENCPQFAFSCPKQWSQLAPTQREGERLCGACDRTVYYCATIDEARGRAGRGECVAIDLASPRWQGDMAPPFRERMCEPCDLDVGEGLNNCPRCGGRVEP